MITRALESKEERKDAKRTKKEKEGLNATALEIQCRSIGRNQKTDSSLNAAALGKNRRNRKLAEWWMLLQH